MVSGIVKFYSELQGIGFITPIAGGPEFFINAKTLQLSGLPSLKDGQKVRFDLSEDGRTLMTVEALSLI